MTPIQIRDLRPEELPAAGAIAGRALADSPMFHEVYPTNAGKRTAALGQIFGALLKAYASHGRVFGAFGAGTLLGVSVIREPGGSQLSALEKLAFGKAVAAAVSLGFSVSLQKVMSDLALRDPQVRHFHLGPVAVEPSYQRKGYGTALMQEFCRRVDLAREISAAETDRKAVIPFLTKFGFKELTSAAVGGVSHAFLVRSRT
ncbi:MAG: GNAT family N-acetyltransferase [Opitutaceae bacterium]|nr:GNAT family N-acetyltransferase [Opitutaceae bacterium]